MFAAMRAYLFVQRVILRTSTADFVSPFFLFVMELCLTTGKPPRYIRQNCNCYKKNAKNNILLIFVCLEEADFKLNFRMKKLLMVLVVVIGIGSLYAFTYFVKSDNCNDEQHVFCSETCSTHHGTEDGICPDCAGKGMIKCSNCLGRGELKKSCNKCNGNGTIREVCGSEIIGTENCSQCNGSGWYQEKGNYTCPRCNGSCRYTNSHGDKMKCPFCNNGYTNTKSVQCPKCNGNRKINLERSKYCDKKCNICFGDGFLLTACSFCNQTGMKPCTKCNSTGKVD